MNRFTTNLKNAKHIFFLSLLLYTVVPFANAVAAENTAGMQQPAQVTIRGKVTDPQGDPVIGANVMVPGSAIGVSSGLDGSYEIRVPATATALEFSYIGMDPQTVLIDNRTTIDVQMASGSIQIETAIVTGYGTIAREAYTGSASVLSSEKIGNRAISSMESALRGNVTGALVTSTGQPGEGSEIRLRGFGSMNAGNQPLFVVDGMIWDQENTSGTDYAQTNPLNTLNPSDIESTTILKDAASAALYGSRGANGVIVITTKKGRLESAANITLNVQSGLSKMTRNPDMVNGREYAELWVEGQLHSDVYDLVSNRTELADVLTKLYFDKDNFRFHGRNFNEYQKIAQQKFNELFAMPTGDGSYRSYDYFGADYDKLPDTDWYDKISRMAPFNKVNLSLSGGSKSMAYYASLEYMNQQGVIINSQLERFAMRVKLNSDLKENFVNWGLNTYIANSIQTGPQSGSANYNSPLYAALRLPPVIPAYLEDGSYNFSFPMNILDTSHNPVASAKENDNRRPTLNMTLTGNIQLNFTPWLNLSSRMSVAYMSSQRHSYSDKEFGYGSQDDGELTERDVHRTKLTNTTMLTADKAFGLKNRHRINATAGVEIEDLDYKYREVTVSSFLSNDKNYLSNGSVMKEWKGGGYGYSQFSVISNVNYNYRSRYYAAASFRNDQSSRFLKGNRGGSFWSVSGSWRITNEDFMKPYRDVINSLKLKASVGTNGNLPSEYYSMQTFKPVNYVDLPGAVFESRVSEDLTWEKNRIWNFGFESGFFNNRIKFSAEYYDRKTKNLLLDMVVSNTSGQRTVLVNSPTAGIKNTGWEFELSGTIYENKDWYVGLNFNIATLKSRIFGLEAGFPDSKNRQYSRNGYSPHSWWLKPYAGINEETGQLQYWGYKDDGTPEILNSSTNSPTQMTGKQGIPKYTGGLSLSASYKNFDISALFSFAGGHHIFNRQASMYTENDGYQLGGVARNQLDRWTPLNTTSKNPLRMNDGSYSSTNTRFLYKGDYLKLRNVTFGYTLPERITKAVRLKNAKVFIQGENLWLLSEIKDYDPELSMDGYRNYDTYPFAITFTAGLNINF